MGKLDTGDILERIEVIVDQTITILKKTTTKYGSFEFDLNRQLFRSITSVGANLEEANVAMSNKEFKHKLSISVKEAAESKYWIQLSNKHFGHAFPDVLLNNLVALIKILKSIIGKL